jgi:CRISPR-associated protein Csm4
MLYGEQKLLEILEAYKKSPPFLLSSAFPFRLDGKEYRYFLPKPVLKPIVIRDLDSNKLVKNQNALPYHSNKLNIVWLSDEYKKFKNIKWIPLINFKRVLINPNESVLFVDYLDNHFSEPKFSRSGTAQKNSLDRLTQSTTGSGNTFYVPETAYRESFGLYFLLKTKDINDYIRPVLKFLEDSGVGSNTRTGKNWFTVSVIEKNLFDTSDIQKTGNAFITLSRYIKAEAVKLDASFYQIASIRSKVESRLEFAGEDVWKYRVSYFTAGSMIAPENISEHYGGLFPVKVINRKTIYQYGYAYPVWVNGGGKK